MLRGAHIRLTIAPGVAAIFRFCNLALQFIRPKPGFPWVRLTLGMYLMLAGTHIFFEIVSGDIYLSPYSKFVNLSSWMAGTLFLASGIWAEIDRRASN